MARSKDTTKDLLTREDVRAAFSSGNFDGLSGATRAALRTRGLLRSYMHYDGRRSWTTWSMSSAGEALRKQIHAEDRSVILAARAAQGEVTVPVWALRCLISDCRDNEARDALQGAIDSPIERTCGELSLRQLQAEQVPWVAHNFPGREAHLPLLGVQEEVGELAHAHLKRLQGIRGTAGEHDAAGRDAVGDIVVFLSDYCEAMGWDLQACVEETWSKVKQRDWRKDPANGGREP